VIGSSYASAVTAAALTGRQQGNKKTLKQTLFKLIQAAE
jgi:hypothetical protein